MSAIETISEHAAHGGVQGYYRHVSSAIAGPMRFAVYRPPQASSRAVPVLTYLAGLTCTEETFPIKAGAQRLAAELGLMLVAPDVSPRDTGIPGEEGDWEIGSGAGFYVDATAEPWSAHYRMYSYVVDELPQLIARNFPARADRQGLFGHSMGGHGALVIALRNPGRYRSLSALAPIAAPSRVPWGHKAFGAYLGPDQEAWQDWDATALVRRRPFGKTILIDQGTADQFLTGQLLPEVFAEACREAGQPLALRMQPGYDHGYYFVQTFIDDHLRHHAAELNKP